MLSALLLTSLILPYQQVNSVRTAHDLSANISSRFFLADHFQADFGLLPNVSWSSINTTLGELNSQSGDKLYRLFIFGRHGEGYHNLAEEKYGSSAWDSYWSTKDGDGVLHWGPDANLTALGEDQACGVRDRWMDEQDGGLSMPSIMYSSPLARALQTAQLSFNLSSAEGSDLIVLEDLRETIGVHTCDERSSGTIIQHRFPFVQLEDHFTDQDDLWSPDHRESDRQTQIRAYHAISKIMSRECSRSSDEDYEKHLLHVISVTSHSGFIRNMLTALNHDVVKLPTAGILPLVIEATCRDSRNDAPIAIARSQTVMQIFRS